MTTAFTLGATVFEEALSNILLGSFAIPTLVLGVVLILSCQQIVQTTTTITTTTTTTNALEEGDGEDDEEETVYLSDNVFQREFPGSEREKHVELKTTMKEKIYNDDNDNVSGTTATTTGNKKDGGFIYEDNSDGTIHESVMLTPNHNTKSDNGNEGNDSYYYDRSSKYLFYDCCVKLMIISIKFRKYYSGNSDTEVYTDW